MRQSVRNGILLSAASIVVTLLLLELLLRAAGIAYPYFRQVDVVTGFSLRPHAEGWSRDEGNAYITINSHGMRDKERTVAKPANTVRIAVLGDSFMEGIQVSDDDVFSAVLERELRTCMEGKNIEVLNFGVSGFGTAQELLLLQDRVWKFQPDIVLLAVFMENDIRDNTEAMTQDTQTPYFTLTNGALTLHNDFRDTSFFRTQNATIARAAHVIVNHSRILQVLNRVRLLVHEKRHPSIAGDPNRALWRGPHFEDGTDANMLLPPKDAVWRDGWQLTEALIAAMHEDVVSHDAQFIVVTVPHELQAYPDASVRRQAMYDLGVRNLAYADDRVAALGKKAGFTVIRLADRLAASIASGEVLYGFPPHTPAGRGHWNTTGHRLAAQSVSKDLCTR